MLLLLVALGLLAAPMAQAAEIRVLTSGAFKPVVAEVAARFAADTGTQVKLDNDTAGALVRRVNGGETFDVLILTPGALADLQKAGKVGAGAIAPLAKVGIGVAVKAGAPRPDISTSDAFKQTLLAAQRVAMIDPAAGGSSGIYLTRLFERWGIADAIRAKAVLVPGGLVATRLVSGEADIAIHQISEILAVPGADLVGPLPADIQNFTVYAGALAPAPADPQAAAAFLARLSGPDTTPILATKGMQPATP
ncbi:molybdenum ABC transporter substrate-binding protein [Azorhizobium oxalatiphilum]|uniref:Molybdenum ABC transporter substrate-binding protein n=1 Tax=Azorhizobium oxalatiphilum TaxID=980631 RepID=A0A917CHL8_9HYPH|nr:molybdenum ABC transporter substrate-binding protein [Azorhizobium oxalatiphilum]